MSAQHTPGPWIAENQTVYGLDERGEVNRFSALSQGGYRIHSSFQKVRTDEDELRANARLMAAAPDLLEPAQDAIAILDVAIDLWNTSYPDEPDEVLTDLQSRFRAAIARATGVIPATPLPRVENVDAR